MSQDYCTECGVLLTPHSRRCEACGYENSYEEFKEILTGEMPVDSFDDFLLFDNKDK